MHGVSIRKVDERVESLALRNHVWLLTVRPANVSCFEQSRDRRPYQLNLQDHITVTGCSHFVGNNGSA